MNVPHNPEAERACLGAVLLSNSAFNEVALDPEDFHSWAHKAIWTAYRRILDGGRQIDTVTVMDELIRAQVQSVGGVEISEILSAPFAPANVEYYAAIVRRDSIRRRLMKVLSALHGAVQEPDAEPTELLARAYRMLAEVRVGGECRGVNIGEAVKEAFKDFQKALDTGTTWGIPTGLDSFDEKLGGLQVGVVTVVAGRPSQGKSSLVRTLCDGANERGAGVHVFTPEDNRKTYALRALADHSRVNLEKLRTLKGINRGELDALHFAANQLYQRERWLISDHTGISSGDIGLQVRRDKAENKTRVVVVDYVQLLRERDVRRDNRKANVEIALEGLLDLARRENVAVLVVSQLSRECEKRDDKRPMLSDLRETGELEQCAEVVIACYRDEYYNPESKDKGTGEILVLKNKNGRTGRIRMAWDADTATFRPLAGRRQDDYEAA